MRWPWLGEGGVVVVEPVVEVAHAAAEVEVEVDVGGVVVMVEVVLPGEKVLLMIPFSSIHHRRFSFR